MHRAALAVTAGTCHSCAVGEAVTRAARTVDDLYRSHAGEVYRYAYAMLGNRADAEDVTQTTFVNALRSLERGERPRKPSNWLVTIAHNIVRQRWRQQQARPAEVELDHDVALEEPEQGGPSIDDLVLALQRIPHTQREATRDARARGPLLQGDRGHPGDHLVRARDSALPGAALAGRRAREHRHLRACRARDLEAARRPPLAQGQEEAQRAPSRVPGDARDCTRAGRSTAVPSERCRCSRCRSRSTSSGTRPRPRPRRAAA